MGFTYKRRKKIALMKRRGSQCERCGCPLHLRGEQPDWAGSRIAQAHHIISRWAGGSDRQENIILTCEPCEKEYHIENPDHLWIGCKTVTTEELLNSLTA